MKLLNPRPKAWSKMAFRIHIHEVSHRIWGEATISLWTPMYRLLRDNLADGRIDLIQDALRGDIGL